MALSSDEPICPKFQPNIFDPLRCHDCLRQRHLHTGAGENSEVEPQQKSTGGTGTGGITGTGNGIGTDTGVVLTPIPYQAEEKDASSKEDSDGLSVVSSYCDVNGGRPDYRESSLCILSPDCELYICDGDDDDSTDSCRDQSDYKGFSGFSGEDEYLPIHRLSTKLGMTRLDPPPHRPNPRAWMDEARSRNSFTGRSGIKEEREKRESGYFSLGRAAGARSLHDNSPPSPFRHFEKGHPIFSNRNIEPKDTIPFRNPNLGMASERQIPEHSDEDLPVEIPPPDPYEIAVEVEAQVGPRSPSPTPFKIAESLASTGRKSISTSYSRGNPSSHVSSYQQSGRNNSSKQSLTLQSRSSSPSPGNVPFRRSESTLSLSRHNFDGGGWSQGTDPGSRSSLQNTHGRRFESGTLPRNFKSLAGSFKSQSSTVSDFRSALRKTEVNGTLSSQGQDSRSSSPSRRNYNSQRPISLRKTETIGSSPQRYGRGSRSSSPTRRTSSSRHDSHSSSPRQQDSRSSSPSRRNYNSQHPMSLCKMDTRSSSPLGHGRGSRTSSPTRRTSSSRHDSHSSSPRQQDSRSSSPSRRNYNSQHPMSLCKTDTRSSSPLGHGRGSRTTSPTRRTSASQRDSRSSSPPRRNYSSSSLSLLHKSDSIMSLNGRGHYGRCGSPIREGYDIESQALLRNSAARNGLNDQENKQESPPMSPSRQGYNTPSQSIPRKLESNPVSSNRGHDRCSSSPGRRGCETPNQYQLRRTETSGTLNSRNHGSCNSLPSRRSYETPSQSLLHKFDGNRSVRSCDNRSLSPSRKSFHGSEQHLLRKTQTSSSLHSKKPNSHNPSPTGIGSSDPPGYSVLRNANNGGSSHFFQRKNTYNDTKSDSKHSPRSWRESTHSLRSSSLSRSASPSRQTTNGNRTSPVTFETPRSPNSSIRSGGGRHIHEDHSLPSKEKRATIQTRSPSPSPQINMERHTSSQSSMESSESAQMSVGSKGRNREDYAVMADLPKVKRIHLRERPEHMGQPHNQQTPRRQELFKPASHSLSKHPSREWDETVDTEREWHYGGSGYLSRAHSATSLQRSGSPTADESSSWKCSHHKVEQMQILRKFLERKYHRIPLTFSMMSFSCTISSVL